MKVEMTEIRSTSVTKPPEGWLNRKAASRELGLDYETVVKLAAPLKETHPDWFGNYRAQRYVTEHLSPEAITTLRDSLGERAPELWETKAGIKRELGLDWATAKRRVEGYREEHPEWFGTYRSTRSGATTEHYAPPLLDAIRESIPAQPNEGWQTRQALSKEINNNSTTIKAIAERFREEHPDWFRRAKARNGTFEYFAPPLVEEIRRLTEGRTIKWTTLFKEDPNQVPKVIEQQVEQYLADGNGLTTNQMQRISPGLLQAIFKYYPGKFTALRFRFKAFEGKKPEGYWIPERIEEEANQFVIEHGSLNTPILHAQGRVDLSKAINSYYPGKLPALQEKIGAEVTRKPADYWTPERILKQAQEFIMAHGTITRELLIKDKRYALGEAIRTYYPEGMWGLKEALGIEQQKPQGFWTPEKTEQQALEFYRKFGSLNARILRESDRNDLMSAIAATYPGSMIQLKTKLGVPLDKKPEGYWTSEQTLKEAGEFLAAHGLISQKLLKTHGRADLAGAIGNYPGKLTQLNIDMGLKPQRKTGGWTAEDLKNEAERFYQDHENIGHEILRANDRNDMSVAITRIYPGGMAGLRKDLGLELNGRRNYWNINTIEQEAWEAYQKLGSLQHSLLKDNKMGALSQAITSRYPGGMAALKEKLRLVATDSQPVSSDEANKQLERLIGK